jgi:hypothetical protein
MQEHEVIRANTRLISSAADNLLTLSGLQDNTVKFTEYQLNYLSDRRVNLKRAIASLQEGLLEHHIREGEILQPLVGGRLMQAVNREYQEALKKLEEIYWILLNVGPAGILFNSSFLKQKVESLCQLLSSSCTREDSILELLLKLEGEPEDSGPG